MLGRQNADVASPWKGWAAGSLLQRATNLSEGGLFVTL